MKKSIILSAALAAAASVCPGAEGGTKIPVVIDSDANNELDDQHAIAYLLFNADVFDILGVTVNNTKSGGGIAGQYDEALRVMKLCKADGSVPLLKGAEGDYRHIVKHLGGPDYDGHAAVEFIIRTASKHTPGNKLVLLPVGKLTNIALALKKAPAIVPKVRVVWLGSNYPGRGEYNLDNDRTAVNPVIDSGVAFEMVTVRYGKPSGTDAVRASIEEIKNKMPGRGPRVAEPVTGRHGGRFETFGDYSVDLFKNMKSMTRALYDMAAVAIVKNPRWAAVSTIPAPKLLDNGAWEQRPNTPAAIHIWEHFDRDAIMKDFYDTMKNPCLVEKKKRQ